MSQQLASPRRQRGMTTVLVSILLLFIVSIVVLFSSSVSVKEIRTGSNQYRSTRAFEAAQEGLSLGLEYVRANRGRVASTGTNGWAEEDLGRWERCQPNGVVADDFPCDIETNAQRRALLCRYRGPLDVPAADRYRLPIAQPSALPAVDLDGDGTAETSEAALRYRVGALLCLIDPELNSVGADGRPLVCDFPLSPEGADCETMGNLRVSPQAFAVHVVSRGAVMSADAAATTLPDAPAVGGVEQAEARASLAQNYGSFRLIADGPDSPLIAANSVTMRGTFDIVANSNGGGFGIPLSIWTSSVIDPNGTPKSCHIQEFLMTQPANNELIDGVHVCDGCECPKDGSISYKDGGDFVKGNDIVDATGNANVTGERNFPDDMFQYLFGVPKVDALGNERWTEIKDRSTILDGTCTSDPLEPGCCSDLGETSSGLFWSEEDDCAVSQDIVGAPLEPVYLVAEKGFTVSVERFFGVIYKFSRPGDATEYQLRFNGGGALYGAIVADDNSVVDKATGTFALVYSSEIMDNLANNPELMKIGPVPGSWTDLGTY